MAVKATLMRSMAATPASASAAVFQRSDSWLHHMALRQGKAVALGGTRPTADCGPARFHFMLAPISFSRFSATWYWAALVGCVGQ